MGSGFETLQDDRICIEQAQRFLFIFLAIIVLINYRLDGAAVAPTIQSGSRLHHSI